MVGSDGGSGLESSSDSVSSFSSKIDGVVGVRGSEREGGRSTTTRCFEFLRGGGDKDVISWATGMAGNGLIGTDICGGGGDEDGGGSRGETGVVRFKKLDSFWNDMIFSPIGVVGCEYELIILTYEGVEVSGGGTDALIS